MSTTEGTKMTTKNDAFAFVATHVIQTGARRIYVHAEPADPQDGGGLVLYTQEEWEACDSADWTYDGEQGLMFQGTIIHPRCDGATIQSFADCPWTRTDGWNDDGTSP